MPSDLKQRIQAATLKSLTPRNRYNDQVTAQLTQALKQAEDEVARAILARREGAAPDPAITYPGLKEGLEGVAFVDACVRSSRRNGAWVKLAL